MQTRSAVGADPAGSILNFETHNIDKANSRDPYYTNKGGNIGLGLGSSHAIAARILILFS